jgi:hypothetical protein
MKRLLLAAIVAMAASGPAWAQSSMGTGVGVARSTSRSQAISGQGGTGVGIGGNPSATITTNSSVPADQTVRNVPSVFAPGLAAAGLETCLGSVSGGGAFVGTGFSFGTTIPDPGCAARLDARTLWSMGLKKAAVARLCLNGDIYRAMPEVCVQYLPQPAPPPVTIRYAQAEASEEQPYTGGDIWLVEGATGKNRLCNDYDVTQQRCRVWAHVAHSTPKKKLAAKGEASQKGEVSPTAASPAPTGRLIVLGRYYSMQRLFWSNSVRLSTPDGPAGGLLAMERCAKTDPEPGLLQKTSMLCGKFFPPRGGGLPPCGQCFDWAGGMTFISKSPSTRPPVAIKHNSPSVNSVTTSS